MFLLPLDTVTPVAASGVFSLAWLLVVIPLLSCGLLLVIGKAANGWGHFLGTLAPIASFVIAAIMFVTMLGRPGDQRSYDLHLYDWIVSGSWHISAGMQIDQLSILFVLLITGVGSIIHVYSIGYMAHDPDRRRFFAYLNLFIAVMLLLVLADNYLVLYVGWEGVGLASYLLIGFWHHKPVAAVAGNKAFIVNRVGDVGMSLAVMLMLAAFGSSSFADVNAQVGSAASWVPMALGLLLLLGACAKSAQVPLQSWLLDAMEGPTPVSALIHAATMVTAGVYLVTRSHAIYTNTELASTLVVVIGTLTLLAGAWIGCAKDDLKRALAGSTMSQIGYMMLAAGIGPAGYAFAIFHLLTHGFFKANLFLGAGSIMHGMNDEVNMRKFGGLARFMPITFVTFGIAYLAIIGFPFLSGYYSKDHIIEAAFEHNAVIGILAMVGAGVTAFYMTRMMFMTFGGKKRWAEGTHPHESPLVMTIPLIILAILSIAGGLVLNNWIGGFLNPAVGGTAEAGGGLLHVTLIGVVTFALVVIGFLVAWAVFGRREVPAEVPRARDPFTIAGRNNLFGDAVNEAVFMRGGQTLVNSVVGVDEHGVDGAVTKGSAALGGISAAISRWQNGYVRSYALTMVVGASVIGAVIILSRLS